MVDILVIFGSNLNLLGTREPGIYGADSMADILKELAVEAERLGRSIEIIQSNEETSEFVDIKVTMHLYDCEDDKCFFPVDRYITLSTPSNS
mgnify:CR=1 FL=1